MHKLFSEFEKIENTFFFTCFLNDQQKETVRNEPDEDKKREIVKAVLDELVAKET